jgi:ribosomal protein S18 acetylase RimI-like enzyme
LVFAPYNPEDDHEVIDLFANYSHKDYQIKAMGVSKERMTNYLAQTLTSSGVHSIALRNEGGTIGLIGLQALPWMSDHFGLNMYAVPHLLGKPDSSLVHARLLRYVVEELPDVDFLDCRVAVDDVQAAHALEICGFRYVGAETYMGQNVENFPDPGEHPDFEISLCRPEDREKVLEIVCATHVHNRFMYDPLIPRSVSRSLYKRLVTNCFDQPHFRVFVARSSQEAQGFIAVKINEKFSEVVGRKCGSLDFIGVTPGVRNRGLGAALNNHALFHMAQEGVQFVAVRTLASNYAALGNCYKTGFKVTSSSLHFHRWIRRPAKSCEYEERQKRNNADYSKVAYA